MSRFADPDYVRAQYASRDNLDARIALHRDYSTNPLGWHRWLFEQIAPGAATLEVGCGSAAIWAANRDRLPAEGALTLSDASAGMLDAARAALGPDAARFRFAVADVQALPWPDHSFDAALANHMLYHAPDVAGAVAELRRVRRPGGVLYAATNGVAHLAELRALAGAFAPRWREPSTAHRFGLENGAALLSASFGDVRRAPYPDGLAVTDAAPLIAFVRSLGASVDEAAAAGLRAAVEGAVAREGALRITKSVGLFIAR